MKLNSIHFLIFLGVLLMFSSGCGTIIGKTVDSKINPEFNIEQYKRYTPDYPNDGLSVEPVINPFRHEGLVRFNGKGGNGDLKIYIDAHKGFCLPPQINPHVPFWLQFTFPRSASVKVEDAVTKKILLEVNYKRALFATGAGYQECRQLIIKELEKAFAESRKNKLKPTPSTNPNPQTP